MTTLTGRAIVFNSRSGDLGGFVEEIDPRALDQILASRPDVYAFYAHDSSQVLARTTAGTLRLTKDPRALRVEIDLPNSPLGENVAEAIRRQDVSEMSFGFCMSGDPDDEDWIIEGDRLVRRILRIDKLYEVSPTPLAAYSATHINVTGANDWAQSNEEDQLKSSFGL